MELRSRCPSEPEEADGEEQTTDQHGRETCLGDRFATVPIHDARVAGMNAKVDDNSEEHANEQTEERECADDQGVMAVPVKDEREDIQCHVQETIYKARVQSDASDHWFREQHAQRPGEMLGDDGSEVEFDLFIRMPVCCITRRFAQTSSAALEEHGPIEFGEEEHGHGEYGEDPYCFKVLRPAPSQLFIHGESGSNH